MDNDYPIKFIFETINLRLRSLLKYKTLKQVDKSNNNEIEDKIISWFTIPFLSDIYINLRTLLRILMSNYLSLI